MSIKNKRRTVPVYSQSDALEEKLAERKPFIVRDLDIGPCCSKWQDPLYLIDKIGPQQITAHVSEEMQMDFINKNFVYRSIPFEKFIERCLKPEHENFFLSKNEVYYLRSTAVQNQRTNVANIARDFPNLGADIILPGFISPEKLFSSVLRIGSAGVQMWTHYDVMDNILTQIAGTKKVCLFPPSDIAYMYLKGDKSEVLDIDNPDLTSHPLFLNATMYECILHPGETLYIPALWFHNTKAMEYCVNVNIFWMHLNRDMYDPKDLYGNKDPVLASRAIQGVDKAIKTLSELPDDHKDFYARILIEKLKRLTIDE